MLWDRGGHLNQFAAYQPSDGQDRTKLREEQQERAARHAEKPLPVEVNNIPDLAVVESDGGRINTREPGHGPGTHEAAWKESKTALFLRMSSETHAEDPAPEPPRTLLDRQNVGRLVKQIAGTQALAKEDEGDRQGNRLVGGDGFGKLALSLRRLFFSARRSSDGTGSRRGGDDFFQGKENQPNLLRDIQHEFAAREAAFSPLGAKRAPGGA